MHGEGFRIAETVLERQDGSLVVHQTGQALAGGRGVEGLYQHDDESIFPASGQLPENGKPDAGFALALEQNQAG